MFYCIILPATVLVPEVMVPKWGAVYIPSIITLLNAVGTPRCLFLVMFHLEASLAKVSCKYKETCFASNTFLT